MDGVFGTDNPLHGHSAAYDPYWDRIWLTFGDTTFEGTTGASIIYSDDHGATWTALTLPTEWQNVSAIWQSTSIAILNDSILFGGDSGPGFFRVPRAGYRTMGTPQVSAVIAPHTGAEMIATGFYRNSYGAPLLASFINSGNDPIVPGAIYVDGSDDGQTLTELWRDDTFKGTSNGIMDIYGPTANGYILANAVGPAKTLRGQIIAGVLGMFDKYFTLVGDGSTTSFTIAHNMSATPTTLNAYPQNAAAVAQAAPVLTADGTNITLTFASAPANGTSLVYALRFK